MTEEAISPSVRSLLLQEMIEFKRKRAEQRASGQMVPPKPPTTQGIMIMPREEIPTDGVLRLAASREIRWKIDPNNVSLKKGSIESGRTSTVGKTQEPATQPTRLGRPPVSSVGQSPRPPISSTGQSPNVNPPGPAANSSSAVRPQNTLNVVHKKAVGLAPGQKIIKILASAPGTGIHAVRQTAESVKVSSDGYLILNGKPTSIKVTPNTKIVIQPQGAGDSQGSADGASPGSEGSGHTVGSPLGKEVVIKKIPTPAGLQPLSDNEASVSIQPIHQNLEQVSRTGSIQNQSPQNHRQYNVKIGQGQPPARTVAGNQQQGMVPGRVTVQTPRVVNVTGQQNVVPGSGTNPNRTMASDSIEARKQQLDIAQRLLAAKRRQLMQNGPISPKVARLEKDSSPLISSPNVTISRQGNVVNSNVDRVNSLSSNVLQNVNISSDILDSYYSVMNEGGGQKTAEFTAVPLTSIQQSAVQGTSLTNVQQSVQGTPVNIVHQGVQGNTNARNVAIPQHTPVNINRLLHSSPPKNSIVGTPVTVTKSEVSNSESEGSKIMSISALTTALARNIAAGNVQLNRTAPKGTERQLSSGQNTNVVNQNLVTSQTQPVQLGSDSGNPVVINVDPKGGVTQQYLNISQPVQTVIQSPQVMSQAVQFVSQPIQILNQSPQVICQTSQILSQPVVQKSQSVSSAISELLKSTVINNSVSNLLTTDSVGLQNQILSSLANVQTQQIQTLASMPETQTYLTSIQNQSLSSQSQLKPIEALFTGQTAPVMLSSTNKVHQFSPYKPGVSNVSPPKSDRQNLFDVFESGKNETVISPTKSDDFGFASLASDRIPIPVRQSGFPVISDEVLARGAKPTVRGNEFVGSPLNSSVMEALKSKLSPGKPLTGLQPRQVLNLVSREKIRGQLFAINNIVS